MGRGFHAHEKAKHARVRNIQTTGRKDITENKNTFF